MSEDLGWSLGDALEAWSVVGGPGGELGGIRGEKRFRKTGRGK